MLHINRILVSFLYPEDKGNFIQKGYGFSLNSILFSVISSFTSSSLFTLNQIRFVLNNSSFYLHVKLVSGILSGRNGMACHPT